MDLEPYHGKRVKCWTYQVLNYPADDGVSAHLYVYKDEVIGEIFLPPALDGFMHGLTRLQRKDRGKRKRHSIQQAFTDDVDEKIFLC